MGIKGDWDIKFPHIKHISEIQKISDDARVLIYLGGEIDENHKVLTIGKEYALRTSLYSESADVERIRVWVCNSDQGDGQLCIIDKNNFGTISDLRDRKIDKMINK